jgi:acyl-CoA reductase-like NAD-dependent aldehyde dehydrogenase
MADATPDMLIFHEKTFGPVAPVFRFKTEAEAVRLATIPVCVCTENLIRVDAVMESPKLAE